MRKFLIILIFLLSSNLVSAATIQTTGFIPGPVWYSKDPLVAGDTVKIHTVIWNGDTKELSTRVEFYDKSVVLGARDVVVPASELKDVSIAWVVTAGDHYISAKIISSSINNGGKKELTTVSLKETAQDHLFIPVSVKEVDGVPASSGDILKKQVNQATEDIQNILPPSVSDKVSGSFNTIDSVRIDTYASIIGSKKGTQDEIKALSSTSKLKSKTESKPLDATQKPIAYVKLFFLSFFAFIFGNKIVFYGVLLLLIFLIIRSIYRRIRNR